jgi:hypothetical protein
LAARVQETFHEVRWTPPAEMVSERDPTLTVEPGGRPSTPSAADTSGERMRLGNRLPSAMRKH